MNNSQKNEISRNLTEFLSNQKSPESLNKVIADFLIGCLKIDKILQTNDTLSRSKAKMANTSGDYQTPIDLLANQILVNALSSNSYVSMIASEEMKDPIHIKRLNKDLFNIFFDPLDGSSNLKEQQTVGTIFSIYQDNGITLPKGSKQVVAGYIIYTKPLTLVLAINDKTYAFNYYRERKGFFLAYEQIAMPNQSLILYANLANHEKWANSIQVFTKTFLRKPDANMRWSGCMVADIHRLLVSGGLFMYPTIHKETESTNKLRLMYEANPMALIIKNAGGYASSGRQDILEIDPQKLHQKIPVFIGDLATVKQIEAISEL